MPYRREIARKSKTVISESLQAYLLRGEISQDSEVFQLSGNPQKLCQVWDAVEKEILREWIRNNPCRRPYSFWLCASEPRKQIGGSGAGWLPGMSIDLDGLPRYWQLDWKKKDPPVFESQATYLKRLGLLTPTEQKYLKKHSKLLEPEKLVFTE